MTTISRGMSSITDTCCEEEDDSMNPAFVSSSDLFGRTSETLLLLKRYLRVRTHKTAQLVLVHGESGTGKTALIDSLRTPVVESDGFFCMGKYFQDSAARLPYSAIMTAFSDLCDIFLQDNKIDKERRKHIEEVLGPARHILSNAVTNLNTMLHLKDDQDFSAEEMKNESRFVLFKVACKKFLTAMSSGENPVVIFIDDIQWMDSSSKLLLKSLILDTELKNVMMILAYREENATSLMSFTDQAKASLKEETFLDMKVENLDLDAVSQLISASLGTPSHYVRQLSSLVFQRTMGNCLHIQLLMEAIARDGLLEKDNRIYDVEKIRKAMPVSETLATIISRNIHLLPKREQRLLRIASLVGYQFEEKIVMKVGALATTALSESLDTPLPSTDLMPVPIEGSCEVDASCADTNTNTARSKPHDTLNTKTEFADAIAAGFVEEIGADARFCHDKIRSSVMANIDAQEKVALHRSIAKAYLVSPCTTVTDTAAAKYHAASHLHEAGTPSLDKDKIELAQLHLAAAQYCIPRSAFIDAEVSLSRGLKLLDQENMWTTHHDLALQLTSMLAKVNLVIGRIPECRDFSRQAILRAKTFDDKIGPMIVDCEAALSGTQVMDGLSACRAALKFLKIKIPRRIRSFHMIFKLLKIRRLIDNKSTEDLLMIPKADDKTVPTSVRFLFYASSMCLLDGKAKGIEGAFYALAAIEISLNKGFSSFVAPAMAIYAIVEGKMNENVRADRCGQAALLLLEKFPNKEAAIATISFTETMVLHWNKPLEETIQRLDFVVQEGKEIGEVAYSLYGLSNAFLARLLAGQSLPNLEEFVRSRIEQISGDINNGNCLAVLAFCKPAAQFILNMQVKGGTLADLLSLDGEFMTECNLQEFASTTGNSSVWWVALLYKVQLAFHFGDCALAISLLEQMEAFPRTGLTHLYFYAWHFIGCMANLDRFRQTRTRANLRVARRYHKGILSRSACPNSRPYLEIIKAEMLSLQRGVVATQMVVDGYIDAARSAWNRPHLEGLAFERAAFYFVSISQYSMAKQYFDLALHLYRNEWRASAKAEWLQGEAEMVPLDDVGPGIGTLEMVHLNAAGHGTGVFEMVHEHAIGSGVVGIVIDIKDPNLE